MRSYIVGEDICLCCVLRVRSPFVEATNKSDHPFFFIEGSIENASLPFFLKTSITNVGPTSSISMNQYHHPRAHAQSWMPRQDRPFSPFLPLASFPHKTLRLDTRIAPAHKHTEFDLERPEMNTRFTKPYT